MLILKLDDSDGRYHIILYYVTKIYTLVEDEVFEKQTYEQDTSYRLMV